MPGNTRRPATANFRRSTTTEPDRGGRRFYPVEMIGVVINNPWQMLNYETDASPQWQVFFQAVDPNDFGGTAMYMRRYHPMTGADLFAGTQWNEEMQRLNYPVDESIGMPVDEPLRYGEPDQSAGAGSGALLRREDEYQHTAHE